MLARLSRTPAVLLILLGVASIIRIVNANFGYPILYVVPDEAFVYLDALKMLSERNLLSFSQYPPLATYVLLPFFAVAFAFWRLTGVFTSLDQFQFYLLTHEGAMLFVPRIVSALFGVGSLAVTYKLGRLLFPRYRSAALWATALLTLSITHLQFSHLAKPLPASLFFSWLGLYYLIKSTAHTKWEIRWLIISITSITVASGFYFLSLIYVGTFIWIRFLYRHRRLTDYRNVISITSLIIPFIGMWTFITFKTSNSYIPFHLEAWRVLQRYLATDLLTGIKWYLKESWFTEPWLTGWFLVGLLWWRKLPRPLHLLLPVLAANFLIVSFTFMLSTRYLLHTSIISALIGGFAIAKVVNFFSKPFWRKLISASIVVSLLIPPSIWLTRFLATPTFMQTMEWINHNIPSSQMIAYLHARNGPFSPGLNAIRIMQTYNSKDYARLSAVLPTNIYPDNVREVVYLDKFMSTTNRHEVVEFAQKNNIEYLVNGFSHPSQSLTIAIPTKAKRVFLASPFAKGELGYAFDFIHWYGNFWEMIKVNRFGQYIEILQIVP